MPVKVLLDTDIGSDIDDAVCLAYLLAQPECDLVGISCMTSNATRAYQLAGEYRRRGRTVVLGGVHPTLLPDEALQYCDAVVVGEAEGVWEQVVADVQARQLQRVYHQPYPSLERYISMGNRRNTKKRLFDVVPVMTTRGCPYNCEFCCVHDIFGRRIRHLPVDNVVRDIQESGGKIFIFLDDNIIGAGRKCIDRAYRFFNRLKDTGIEWAGQTCLNIVEHDGLLKAAARSGAKVFLIGFESTHEDALLLMNKQINLRPGTRNFKDAIRKIHDHGIAIIGGIMFGTDVDTNSNVLGILPSYIRIFPVGLSPSPEFFFFFSHFLYPQMSEWGVF